MFSVLFIWYSRNTGESEYVEGVAAVLCCRRRPSRSGIPVYLAQRNHMTEPEPVPAYAPPAKS